MLVNIGKGIELETPDTFAADVTAHIMKIGLRNILMDSHAGVTAEKVGADGDVQAQSRAVAEKKLAALIAGDLRTVSTREGDPVRAEAIRLATAAINAKVRASGKKADAKAVRELAKRPDVMEKFMARARQNVEQNRAADIDLGDLAE